jgi:hypothetical protein
VLTNEQLYELETLFGRICRVAGKTRPRSPWAPPLPPLAAGASPPPVEPPYEVVYRKPTPGEYETFRSGANNETRRAKAQELLARATIIAVVVGSSCVIHDGQLRGPVEKTVREAFDKLLIDYPGIPEASANDIGEIAGLAKDDQEK